MPPIRPSVRALAGLAWKKQRPPAVAAARQGLPAFVLPLQRLPLRRLPIGPRSHQVMTVGIQPSVSQLAYSNSHYLYHELEELLLSIPEERSVLDRRFDFLAHKLLIRSRSAPVFSVLYAQKNQS